MGSEMCIRDSYYGDGTLWRTLEESSSMEYAISEAASPETLGGFGWETSGDFAWRASLTGSGRWQSLCPGRCAGYFLSADWASDGSTGGSVNLVERAGTPPGMAEFFAGVDGLGAPAIWTQIDYPGAPPQVSEGPFRPSSPFYNRGNNSYTDWAIPKDPSSPRLQGSRTVDCGFTEVGDHTVIQTCKATATWDVENPYHPPQTTIDSGPVSVTADPTPTFGFSSDEAGSVFECRIDVELD